MTGTKDGGTVVTMDIKVKGRTADSMEAALGKAKNARVHIFVTTSGGHTGSEDVSEARTGVKETGVVVAGVVVAGAVVLSLIVMCRCRTILLVYNSQVVWSV